jgi:hypothetical protein
MRAIHSLLIHCGIPIAVVEYHGIGSRQIDAQSTSTSAQQKREDVRSEKYFILSTKMYKKPPLFTV